MRLDPGRPFWAAFTAFFANLITLLSLDKSGAIVINRVWLGSIIASLIVAGAMYGKEKLSEYHNGKG